MSKKDEEPAVQEYKGAGALSGMVLVRPEGVREGARAGARCSECGSEMSTSSVYFCVQCRQRKADIRKLLNARDTRPMSAWELDEIVVRSGRVRGTFAAEPMRARPKPRRLRPGRAEQQAYPLDQLEDGDDTYYEPTGGLPGDP